MRSFHGNLLGDSCSRAVGKCSHGVDPRTASVSVVAFSAALSLAQEAVSCRTKPQQPCSVSAGAGSPAALWLRLTSILSLGFYFAWRGDKVN